MMLAIPALALAALALSYFGTARLRRWAERRQILAVPNVRSLHDRPIPLGGGLAIVAITLAGALLSAAFIQEWTWQATLAYLLGAVVVSTISWLDDLRTLPIAVRLVAHGIGAVCIIQAFGFWQVISFPWLGEIDFLWWGSLATIVWIVGLTNAYNFMDGIDGIAGSQAVIAGLGWFVLGRSSDQQFVAVLGLLIACASLGFLGHNWPPARIFMGDVGSAFLGYTLAALPVAAALIDPRLVIAGVLLVWPFVFDTAFTFIRRLLKRENVLSAHRSHLYQRLIITGRSHRFVTLLYVLLALTGALLAIAWVQMEAVLAIPLAAMLCLSLWVYVSLEERRNQPR